MDPSNTNIYITVYIKPDPIGSDTSGEGNVVAIQRLAMRGSPCIAHVTLTLRALRVCHASRLTSQHPLRFGLLH